MSQDINYMYMYTELIYIVDIQDVSHESWRSCPTSSQQPPFMSVLQTLTEELQAKNSRIKELEKELERANTMIRDYQNRASDPAPSHISNQLSRIVKSLYKSLHENEKFRTGEGYASPYNRQIKDHLMATIRESHPTFGEKEIRTALYSRYANEKKKEGQKENPSAINYNRTVALRHSVLESRIRVSRDKKLHTEIMKDLTVADMSDYEESEGRLIAKPPRGRSTNVANAIRDIDTHIKYKKPRNYIGVLQNVENNQNE